MNLATPEHLTVIDHLLTTTRSVRKRLDLSRPVEPALIEECLRIALQAPTGSNQQKWHFIVLTDRDKRKAVADLYHKSFELYRPSDVPEDTPAIDDPHAAQMQRVISSARYLSNHMHEVPVLIIGCYEGRPDQPEPFAQAGLYGSILPAAWSLMLALRARGLGAAWTTLHLRYEREVAEILDLPDNLTQAVLLPVAYFTGDDFKPAKRQPASQAIHWNGWDG